MFNIPQNEPVKNYLPGSPEKLELKKELERWASTPADIPCIIGGREIRTGKTLSVIQPHSRRESLGRFHLAGPEEIEQAISAALKAKADWEALDWEKRCGIFLRAADLLAGRYRSVLNATTMLGQSKSVYQAEIDSACELIDFFRFNAYFYQEILKWQPISSPGVKNSLEYRPLEGFVTAITPFNFTAIGGNLPSAPALVGNTVLWKPASTQVLSAYCTMNLLKEAGLPPGVINFIPTEGKLLSQVALQHRDFAGVHFTGSTQTFDGIIRLLGERSREYKSYPRIVGETGGKDFVFAHPSGDPTALVTALVRGAFEYQGQKCSAASRAYIPRSIWTRIKDSLIETIQGIKMGDVRDFTCFMNAVIDEASYDKIMGYLDQARRSPDAEILVGGTGSKDNGYFIHPTLILAKTPRYRTMIEEIFGPVLTIFVYEDAQWRDTAKICDESSEYALTGAIFCTDPAARSDLMQRFKHSAGNFYINDKPTGAVVGQQPFGGARKSGTNDKAGSPFNLFRWISPRTIKETFEPPKDYRYPFMSES